jgi:hypothetical protein
LIRHIRHAGHFSFDTRLACELKFSGGVLGRSAVVGHIHLGVLPSTKRWRAVVALLEEGATAEDLAAAAAFAAEREFEQAPNDPIFVETLRLLALIPAAARRTDFGRALRELGLNVGDAPSLLDITTAAGAWLDRFVREQAHPSDFGELSRRALLAGLSTTIGDQMPTLFDTGPEDVRLAARTLSASANFSMLARVYFSRLTSESLSNWLDRTLSAHVGPGQRFAHAGERLEFGHALETYCWEATRIIREFSGGWYGKTLHREGTIHTANAAGYGAIAFRKIVEELRRKRDDA